MTTNTVKALRAVDKELIDAALDSVGCDSKSIREAGLGFTKVTITLEVGERPKIDFNSYVTKPI